MRMFTAEAQNQAVHSGAESRVVSRPHPAGDLVRQGDELVAWNLRHGRAVLHVMEWQKFRVGGRCSSCAGPTRQREPARL